MCVCVPVFPCFGKCICIGVVAQFAKGSACLMMAGSCAETECKGTMDEPACT